MMKLEIDSLYWELPSSFEEMEDAHYLYLCQLISQGSTRSEVLLKLLLRITGIRISAEPADTHYTILPPEGKPVRIEKEDLVMAAHVFNWALKEENGVLAIQDSLGTQKLPEVSIAGKIYLAPGGYFSNVVWGEFMMVQSYYTRYVITRDETWLYHMLAAMYRPKRADMTEDSENYDGDLRIPYNGNRDEKLAEVFRDHAPPELVLAASHYVTGCMGYLKRTYPRTFYQPDFEEGSGEPRSAPKDPFHSLFDLTDQLAQDATKTETVTRTNMHYVCRRIENLKKEEARMKAAQKQKTA